MISRKQNFCLNLAFWWNNLHDLRTTAVALVYIRHSVILSPCPPPPTTYPGYPYIKTWNEVRSVNCDLKLNAVCENHLCYENGTRSVHVSIYTLYLHTHTVLASTSSRSSLARHQSFYVFILCRYANHSKGKPVQKMLSSL